MAKSSQLGPRVTERGRRFEAREDRHTHTHTQTVPLCKLFAEHKCAFKNRPIYSFHFLPHPSPSLPPHHVRCFCKESQRMRGAYGELFTQVLGDLGNYLLFSYSIICKMRCDFIDFTKVHAI